MTAIICAVTLEENKIYQGKKQKLLLMWEFLVCKNLLWRSL